MEKLSIYVVEDDESIRTMVVYALNGSGYEAQGFPGGNLPGLFRLAVGVQNSSRGIQLEEQIG